MKIALPLVLLALAGCQPSHELVLGDDWTLSASGRYVIGTTTRLHLTELVPDPDYVPSFFGGSTCDEYDCVRLDDEDFRVTSSDPAVFEIEERRGWVGHARSVGEAWVEARHDGRIVARRLVRVAVPERITLELGPLDQFAHGTSEPLGPHIAHVAGGVLDLGVHHWVGDELYRSSAPMVVETTLPVQMVLEWPPATLRILDAEPGLHELVVEVAGHRAAFEIESYDPAQITRAERTSLPSLSDVPRASGWHYFALYAEDQSVFGLASFAWRVDGRDVGAGGILACDSGDPAPATVEARLGDRVERFVLDEGCAHPAVVPWLEPLPAWFAPR